jgi:hypothetical protein
LKTGILFRALAILACVVGLVTADPTIVGPDKVEPYKLVRQKIDGLEGKANVVWDVQPFAKVDLATDKRNPELIFVAPPGKYEILLIAITVDKDGASVPSILRKTVVVGNAPDPGPEPGPEPGPTPDPDNPAPIPEAGFRVLMVYETATVGELPKEQSSVLFSKKVRDYLDQKCVVGSDNKTKEWRIWDKDVDASGAGAVWAKAMNRDRKSIPWIVISNGKTGFEGPLPGTVDETIKLLKKYGGE